MKRAGSPLLLLLLAGCGGSGSVESLGGPPPSLRGTLVGTPVKMGTISELDGKVIVDGVFIESGAGFDNAPTVTNAVDVYRVTYRTVDAQGNPTQATGAVAIPQGVANPDLVCYQHSTQTKKAYVPSQMPIGVTTDKLQIENPFAACVFAGAGGFVVSMPDYLGLGLDPAQANVVHPYVHADTEASAGLDLARAVRTFVAGQGINLGSQTFVSGYSQGGHAAMALARAMQATNGEFAVAGLAPGSGPYDPVGSQMPFAFRPAATGTGAPLFLGYLGLAYSTIYGQPVLADAFVAPYASQLPSLYDGSRTLEQYGPPALPADPNALLVPTYRDAVLNDPNNPFRRLLQQNATLDWTPNFPVRLFYTSQDEEVAPANTTVALANFQGKGVDVQATDVGADSHADGIAASLGGALTFFVSEAD